LVIILKKAIFLILSAVLFAGCGRKAIVSHNGQQGNDAMLLIAQKAREAYLDDIPLPFYESGLPIILKDPSADDLVFRYSLAMTVDEVVEFICLYGSEWLAFSQKVWTNLGVILNLKLL
jgi:hypothetical protein